MFAALRLLTRRIETLRTRVSRNDADPRHLALVLSAAARVFEIKEFIVSEMDDPAAVLPPFDQLAEKMENALGAAFDTLTTFQALHGEHRSLAACLEDVASSVHEVAMHVAYRRAAYQESVPTDVRVAPPPSGVSPEIAIHQHDALFSLNERVDHLDQRTTHLQSGERENQELHDKLRAQISEIATRLGDMQVQADQVQIALSASEARYEALQYQHTEALTRMQGDFSDIVKEISDLREDHVGRGEVELWMKKMFGVEQSMQRILTRLAHMVNK